MASNIKVDDILLTHSDLAEKKFKRNFVKPKKEIEKLQQSMCLIYNKL